MFDTLLIRLVLQPYWRLTRSQTLGVQGVVTNERRQVLLIRHSYVRGWHLPGGGVERNEDLEQALRRELLEESGVEMRSKPNLHGIFSNFERSKGDHIAVYVVRDWTLVQAPTSKLEIIEQRFFDLNELPEGLIPGARRRLSEIFDSHPISTDW